MHTMKLDYLAIIEKWRRAGMTKKFAQICDVLNTTLNYSLNKMIEHSTRCLERLTRRLLLSFDIEHEYQRRIEFLLSKNNYIMRCRGLIESNRMPSHMENCFHPKDLYGEYNSDFRRRIMLVKNYVIYFVKKLQKGNLYVVMADELGIQENIHQRGPNNKTLLSLMKITPKTTFLNKSKRMDHDAKTRLRTKCRDKLYSIEDYLREKHEDFVSTLFHKASCSVNFGVNNLICLEFSNVVSGILSEFYCNFGPYEFHPSLQDTEAKLKELITHSLCKLKEIPKLTMNSRYLQEGPTNFDLSASEPDLVKSLSILDESLADCMMPLLAFTFFMQCFSHLLIDKNNLVGDELKTLIDENDLEPVEREATLLVRDRKLVQNLPKSISVGVFRVDISDITKSILNSIDETLRTLFSPHIGDKFESLLSTNKIKFLELRDQLLAPAPEIDQYIEMKRFLEGEDIRRDIDSIGTAIKLCRKLNKFEEEIRFTSFLITSDYLDALSWVNELSFHHEMAAKKSRADLPKFRDQLNTQMNRLNDEFNQTKHRVNEFDNYNDDKEAELYCKWATDLSQNLDSYLQRAIDINEKLEILGEKKRKNLENDILAQKTSFNRYLDLWSFIANQWNSVHNSWKRDYLVRLDKNYMSEVIGNGLALLYRLQENFRDNEVVLKLVRNKKDEVNKFSNVLEVVKILKDPAFKDRHWDELFNHIKEADKNDSLGLREGRPDLSKITLGQLMLANVMSHQQILRQIHAKAQSELTTEIKIKEIRYAVENIAIKPAIFDMDNTGLSIFVSIKQIISKLSEHLSTCMNMLADPNNPEEFKRELTLLSKLLSVVSEVFTAIHIIQNKLIKYSPIFRFRELERFLTKKDTMSQFLKLREEFKKIFGMIEEKKMKMFIESIGVEEEEHKISDLLSKLKELNQTSEYIGSSLSVFYKMIRVQSPRYFYTSDEQMLTLCSLIKFPKSLLGFVTTLFKGLSGINVGSQINASDSESVEIVSVVTRSGEVVTFKEPLVIDLTSNAQIPLISIVKCLEKNISLYLDVDRKTQLQIISDYHFDFSMIYTHWQEKNLIFQQLSLCLQILFDFEISMLFQACSNPDPKVKGKTGSVTDRLLRFREKVQGSVKGFVTFPIRYLRGKMKNSNAIYTLNTYIQMIQSLLGQLEYLLVNEITTPSDFRFLMIPKYSVMIEKSLQVREDDPNHISKDDIAEMIESEINPQLGGNQAAFRSNFSTFSKMISTYYCAVGQKVVWSMMGYTLDYRNEILPPNRNIAAWPLFERSIFGMFLAVATCPHLILKGFPNQGKLETIRALNEKLAANYYEVDMSFDYSVATASLFVYGMISGGYWLTFKNMEKAPSEMLSILASFADEIRQSMAASRTKIKVYGEELLIKGSHVILCTYNVAKQKDIREFEALASNITDQFRVISAHHPDYIAIISSLISLVFDADHDKVVWINRLLFFCKVYKNVEMVEGPVQPINSASSESLSVYKVTNDITLRDMTAVIRKTLLKYFRYVEAYYESFKEQSGKYRIDINILHLDPDRMRKFTEIFKQEVMDLLGAFEVQESRLKAIKLLLNKVFLDPEAQQTRMYLDVSPSVLYGSDKIMKAITSYKDIFPSCNLPDKDDRTLKFIEPFIEAFVGSEGGKQFIIFGEPNVQKSTLIRLIGFIESELLSIKFVQYWLNLECLSKEDIFGSQEYHGILREILLQTNNINLEDKSANNINKLNYLFQSNSDLFHNLSDPRGQADLRAAKKVIDKASSWIVIDANSSKSNPLFYARVSFLQTIFNNLYEQREVNQYVGFNEKLKVVYEMTSIAELEPRNVSDSHLLYIRESLLTSEDRLNAWMKELGSKHYFFREMAPKILVLVTGLIFPMLAHIRDNRSSQDVMFFTTELSLLNNFLIYFEIMLNEFRKIYVAYDLSEAKNSPEAALALKKASTQNTGKTSKGGLGTFNYGAAMRMAQEAGGTNLITSQRSKKVDLNKGEDDQISSLSSREDIEEFEKRKIEGLAIFCFVGAVYPMTFSSRHNFLTLLVDKFCTQFCQKNSINKQVFGDGLFKLVADKKMGGLIVDIARYLYDFTQGRWVSWETLKDPSKIEISSSFSSDNFSRMELTRLNATNSAAYYKADNQNYDDIFGFVLPVEKTIIHTSNVNHMRYMLDLFLNYKRHVLLMSDHQQGKSSFLGHEYLRKLVEQRQLIVFNFALQYKISPRAIQTQIESNLLRVGGNEVHPPEKKRVVIWVDDLQMSMNEEKPESLVRSLQVQNGWFSSNKKNFIKISDCQFLMTFSTAEANPEASRQSINALNQDVLAKCLLLKTHRLNYDDLSKIFFEQVRNQIDPNPSSRKEKLVSKLFHQFTKMVFFNQDQLRSISSARLINLNLEAFCQFARSLNLVEWETVAENGSNTLFVWYKTVMNFFSCDFNFQHIEFETIVKEKQNKMRLIKVPRRSTVFDSAVSQRFSVKVNRHMIEQLLAEMKTQRQSPKKKLLGKTGSYSGAAQSGKSTALISEATARLSGSGIPNKANLFPQKLTIDSNPNISPNQPNINNMQAIVEEEESEVSKESEESEGSKEVEDSEGSKEVEDSGSKSQSANSKIKQEEHDDPSEKLKTPKSGGAAAKFKNLKINIKRDSISDNMSALGSQSKVKFEEDQEGVAIHSSFTPNRAVDGENDSVSNSEVSQSAQNTFSKALKVNMPKVTINPPQQEAESPTRRAVLEKAKSMVLSDVSKPKKNAPRGSNRISGNQAVEAPTNLLTVKPNKSRKNSASAREISAEVSEDQKRKSIDLALLPSELTMEARSKKTNKSKNPSNASSIGGSHRNDSAKSSSDSSNDESGSASRSRKLLQKKRQSTSQNSESDQDELSEEQVDPDTIRDEFTLDQSIPINIYFKMFIDKTMDFKLPFGLKAEDTLKQVCFDRKHLIDEVLLKEQRDLRDNENYDHTFVVPNPRLEKDMMDYMKGNLKSFIKLNPEGLFALKLDGGNFPLLIHHFSMLSMNLLTEFQQVYISAVKSLLYCKTLVQFVCSSLGFGIEYVDLLGCTATKIVDDKLIRLDAYEYILDSICGSFLDLWKLRRKVIMIHVPNAAILTQHQPLLDKVLDFVSSIVLKTDMLMHHLGSRMNEMCDIAKKDANSDQYSDFDTKFMIRNRLQAQLTFVFINDCTQNYIEEIRLDSTRDSPSFYKYFSERYPRVAGKFCKQVLNGIKCLEPADTPMFYQPPLSFEEIEISPFCAKSLNSELNFLRCVDKDKHYFSLVRPYNENIILYNTIKYTIRTRFQIMDTENEAVECNRDKNSICQRIERRKEVIDLEIKEIDSQIASKEKERLGVLEKQAQLHDRREECQRKKQTCHETIDKLHLSLAEHIRQETLYLELKAGLQETLRAVKEFKEKDIQLSVQSNNFRSSKLFAVYSVIFCETFGFKVDMPLELPEIEKLTEDTVNRDRVSEYTNIFEEVINQFQTKFVEIVATVNSKILSEEKTKVFCGVVERMSQPGSTVFICTSIQRVLIKVIDSAVETIKLEQQKAYREAEMEKINETISLLIMQVERADKFLAMIEEGLNDQPVLIARIDERIALLGKKRQNNEQSLKLLTELVENLNKYQEAFARISQPILDMSINRDVLIEVLAAYIVIFNKYPYTIKKKLLFVALQNSGLDPALFEEVPIFEILSGGSLMTDITRAKIPCNTNFLTNMAIIDLLHEEQSLIYPLVIDRAKLVMKWLQSKYPKGVYSDRYIPASNTLDQIEHCMRTGNIFVAVDPNEELTKLIRPIVEWQLRRFTEGILQINNNNLDIMDSVMFFGKKIHVNKGFFLLVLLEVMQVEEVDQYLMSQLLVVDNSILSEGLFCETVADELAMNLENNTRGFYVSEYLNKSVQVTIVDHYKKILAKGRAFDFLKDSLDNNMFKQLLNEIDHFGLMLENLEREKAERKSALEVYQQSQLQLYSIKFNSELDEQEFRFLNYPYAFKVTGFLKMVSKFLPYANQFWMYFLGIHKMSKYVGEAFSVNYDILTHLIKHAITVSEIKVSSADIEKRSGNFEKLFANVERQVYFSLCSMIPGDFQFLFSFTLGCLLLQKKVPNKVGFETHVNLIFLSEKILNRHRQTVSFSTSILYGKFNQQLQQIIDFYEEKEAYLPQLLSNDPADIEQASHEVKLGLSQLLNEQKIDVHHKSDDLSYKEKSMSEVQGKVVDDKHSNALKSKKPPARSNESDSDSESGGSKSSEPSSEKKKEAGSKKSLNSLSILSSPLSKQKQQQPISRLVAAAQADESLNTFAGIQGMGSDGLLIAKFSDDKTKLDKESRIAIAIHIFKEQRNFEPMPELNQETLVRFLLSELDFAYPEMRPKDIAGVKLGYDQFVSLVKILIKDLNKPNPYIGFTLEGDAILTKARHLPQKLRAQGNRKASIIGLQGFAQMNVLSKMANFQKRKSFKAFTEMFIEKQKVKKYSYEDSVASLGTYTMEIMKNVCSSMNSLLPDLPHKTRIFEDWDLLTLMAFFKYARPDWIEGLMRQFYAELRGPSYYRPPRGYDSIFTFSMNRRCNVLLFQKLDSNPVLVVEKMALKTNAKYSCYNAVRGNIEEFKSQLDQCNKKGSWLIIENLHKLPEIDASMLVKEANEMLEKGLVSPGFRAWIIYQLPQDIMHVKTSVIAKSELPLWFGVCYYIFLDEPRNVSQDLFHLNAIELGQLSKKIYSETIDKASRGEIGKQLKSELFLPESGARSPASPTTPSRPTETASLIEAFIPSLLEKPIVLVTKKVKCDLIWEIQTYQASKGHLVDFVNSRTRTQFMIKFILSILRQRKNYVQDLMKNKQYLMFNFAKDRQFDTILTILLDLASKPGCSNPLQMMYLAISNLFCDSLKVDDINTSPIIFLHLIKLLLFDAPKTDMRFDFGNESYWVPGVKTFEEYGTAYIGSVLQFPLDDSAGLLGLRTNEEAISRMNRSADCFRLLNSKTTAKELLQDYSNHLEDFSIENFAADNKKSDEDMVTRFFLNSIEYGFNLIQNHEFKSELRSDLKQLINCLLETFSESLISKIEREVNIQIEVPDPMFSFDDSKQLDIQGQLLQHSNSQSDFLASPSKMMPKRNRFKDFGNIIDDDFIQKSGFVPRKTRIYMTLNVAEKSNRGLYRKYIILHEFRLLSNLLKQLRADLTLAKFSLEGESLARHKEYAKDITDNIANNNVPDLWLSRVKDLLVDTSSFRALTQSLMKKLDAIYSMVIDTKELPPIINISRFLSPKSFLVNILEFNAALNKVSLTDSVIMIAQKQADSNVIYKNSMIWTINGLKLRGGKIDAEGLLINEDEREYLWSFGPIHLEITQFPKSGNKSLESQPHIAIMLNTNFEDELNLEAEFENAQKIALRGGELSQSLTSKRITPDEAIEKMVYELCKKPFIFQNQTTPEPSTPVTPALRHRQSVLQSMSKSPVNTPRHAAAAAPPPVQDPNTRYVIRLPVYVTSSYGFNPMTELSFYFYCYSSYPQIHWIKRGTYLTFDEKFN